MKGGRRFQLALGGLLALAALSAYWSCGELRRERTRAAGALSDLRASESLASELAALRERPAAAHGARVDPAELTARIEDTAKALGIRPQNITRIDPEAPRRVAGASYVERRTRIALRRVPLPAFGGLLLRLASGLDGMQIREIRLTAPRGEEVGTLWQAEATLAYWLYSPDTTPSEN